MARRPTPNTAQRRLLDDVERAIRGIRHPVDSAEVFHRECHLALQQAGLYATSEVPMSGGRRVDLVVVDARGALAIELDRDQPRRQTLGKFADMPSEVLRMLVLRHRNRYAPPVPNCDRVVCVVSSLRMLRWLVDGVSPVREDGTDTDARSLREHGRRTARGWRWDLLARRAS